MPGIFNWRAADIILILAAPTPWSTTIMTDNPKTCVDPYLESFAQSFAAASYTAGAIRTYRHLTRKLGRLMDTAGIVPSALSPALADQLARTSARGPDNRIRFHNLARPFAEFASPLRWQSFVQPNGRGSNRRPGSSSGSPLDCIAVESRSL
jgi:hypothetical protein